MGAGVLLRGQQLLTPAVFGARLRPFSRFHLDALNSAFKFNDRLGVRVSECRPEGIEVLPVYFL